MAANDYPKAPPRTQYTGERNPKDSRQPLEVPEVVTPTTDAGNPIGTTIRGRQAIPAKLGG